MRYEVEVNGRLQQVTVIRREGGFEVTLGKRRWMVDAAEVDDRTLSLLIARDSGPDTGGLAGATGIVESHEVSMARDPATGQFVFGLGALPLQVSLNARRRWGPRDGASSGSGPQRIVAPMPGKIVRVLAAVGDAVLAKQPVVVVEAMKMENELRAPQAGRVEQVLVREGQSVEAGTVLAVISTT